MIELVARTKKFFVLVMSMAFSRGNFAHSNSIVHRAKAKRQFKKISKRMKEMKEKYDSARENHRSRELVTKENKQSFG